MVRRKILDDDEAEAAAFRDRLNKLGQGFEATGRSANADDPFDIPSSQKQPRLRDIRIYESFSYTSRRSIQNLISNEDFETKGRRGRCSRYGETRGRPLLRPYDVLIQQW